MHIGSTPAARRSVAEYGFHCEVIAPSLIPRKPGDRRKTDRLDAAMLAEYYRGGHLTPVVVPGERQEAVRQLLRGRLALQSHITRLKHRIVRTLATHGHRFQGSQSNWTQKHRAWLQSTCRELDGPLQTIIALHLEHLEYLEALRNSLDDEIERLAQCEPWRRGVEALCCFRGIKTLIAMVLLSEIGDIRRFASHSQTDGLYRLGPG